MAVDFRNGIDALRKQLEELKVSIHTSFPFLKLSHISQPNLNGQLGSLDSQRELEEMLTCAMESLTKSLSIFRVNIGPWVEVAERATENLKPIYGLNETVSKCSQDMEVLFKV
jgi:hypothetical protein